MAGETEIVLGNERVKMMKLAWNGENESVKECFD